MSCPSCYIGFGAAFLLGALELFKNFQLPEAEKSVAIFHLDLGIGGAEQLMIHLGSAFKQLGYEVTFITAFHDKKRSFPSTTDGTFKVQVHGAWIPRVIFGRFQALMSLIKMFWCLLCVIVSRKRYSIVVNDQVSAINPFLYLITQFVFFYCHFPDLALCPDRSSSLKKLYRMPLDYIEDQTTFFTNVTAVNSKFTLDFVEKTFPKTSQNSETSVLYPPVLNHTVSADSLELLKPMGLDSKRYFVSLNRFERKKNVGLSIDAFILLTAQVAAAAADFKLVIAGGYDDRLRENVEYKRELEEKVAKVPGLKNKVVFLTSISDSLKWALLKNALATLYTPEGEHFGMIPCESMSVGTPVVASSAPGGPRETVVHGKTGYLCKDAAEFSESMEKLLVLDGGARDKMGEFCVEYVQKKFGFDSFVSQVNTLIENDPAYKGSCCKKYE